MSSNNSFFVYKHTTPSGKIYIGITGQMLCQRWANGQGYRGNKHFTNAIKKYGWKNIKHEVLFSGLTQKEAEEKEIELIAQYDSTNPKYGYNIADGGNLHPKLSEEARRKISDAHKGRSYYVHGEKHPMFGRKKELCPTYKRKHTPEERARMSANNTRKKAVICIETGIVYDSAQAAAAANGTYKSAILNCCNKKIHYNTAGGYHWGFANG